MRDDQRWDEGVTFATVVPLVDMRSAQQVDYPTSVSSRNDGSSPLNPRQQSVTTIRVPTD